MSMIRSFSRSSLLRGKHILKSQKRREFSAATATANKNSLTDEANVVIIGGGAAGCSVAYHLAKQGCEGVVLLEMSELTAGSTWHAAGLVTSYHPLANLKPLHQYSLNLFSQLEKETDQAINFHNPGSIRITTTEERAEEMRYQVSRTVAGNPMKLLTPEEIYPYCPLLDIKQVKCGLLTHGDGHVDPYSLTQAYAKAARNYGAKIHQNTRVLSVSENPHGGWQIETSKGKINTTNVVNAAGFHAKEIGAMSDIHLPLIAVEHQYIVSKSLPEVQKLAREIPVLRHLEASSYIRMERDGLLVGVYENEQLMKLTDKWVKDGVPEDFSKQLFEPDLERSESYLAQVMELIPCLKTAQIQSVVNGPITYTPDGLPLLGPYIRPGMWIAAGFGYGIVHSGGIGKYMADYIMNGEPPVQAIELECCRFKPSWTTDDYTLAKVRETYGLQNAVGYINEERFAGRPSSRTTPAYERQTKRGASYLPHAGWEQPAWFDAENHNPEYKPSFQRTNWTEASIRESENVMNAAGVIDLTPFGKFLVEGSQAKELLSRITANSLPREGRCVVTHALTKAGTILAEWTVSQVKPGKFMVITGSGSEMHDLRWLIHQAHRWGLDDVSIVNVTDDMACLSVAGPKAQNILSKASQEFPQKFPYFSCKEVQIGGVPVTALRISYTGELGWELYHPMDQCDKLYQAILEAGEPEGLVDFGTHALNMLRLEKGFRGWGAEMTLNTTMLEAGMIDFVDMKKEEFLGKSALLQQMKSVPKKLLVQVVLDSQKLDPIGDENVYAFGAKVGATTSGCFSPHLGKSLAFCYLPPLFTVPGTTVQVELLNELIEGTVLPQPPMMTHFARTRKNKT